MLAVRAIPGAKDVWNWPALFDYGDRYYDNEFALGNISTSGNHIRPYFANFYTAHKGSGVFGPVWGE